MQSNHVKELGARALWARSTNPLEFDDKASATTTSSDPAVLLYPAAVRFAILIGGTALCWPVLILAFALLV